MTACSQAASPGSQAVHLTVDAGHPGASIPASFLGLAFEYDDILRYAGRSGAPDPAVVRLLRNLEPAGAGPPVLRVGGSTRRGR